MAVGQHGKTIAVIPARGGSKRIPGKNIIDFMGKPMLAWTIDAALKSELFEAVYVSTDDEQIGRVAVEHGASVPHLRESYADDHSPVSLATLHFVKSLLPAEQASNVVQLLPNCPLRSAENIRDAFALYQNEGKKNPTSVISAMPYGMFNPWWAHSMNEDGSSTPLFREKLNGQRSQDLAPLFCPTGSIWISCLTKLSDYRTFYSPGYRLLNIGWKAGIDIDDFDDLELAKAAFAINTK